MSFMTIKLKRSYLLGFFMGAKNTMVFGICVVLVLSYCLVNITPFFTMDARGDGSGDYPSPAEGDWIIENDTTVSDENIILDGNLIISANATLTLDRVKLRINSSISDMHSITVEALGNLEIYHSEITNLTGPYLFIVNGNMTLESSTVSNMTNGIDVEYGDVYIGNCTIFSHSLLNQYGLKVNGSPTLVNNHIHSNQEGITTTFFGSPILINNTITNNNYGVKCIAFGFATLIGNNISHNFLGGVLVELGHFEIHNNTISSNGGFGIHSDHASINLTNNSIYGNERWGVVTIGAPLHRENNTFLKDGNVNREGDVLVAWDIVLRMVDQEGEPVENVNVTIRNAQGDVIWKGGTIGNVRTFVLREYEITNRGDEVVHTPYKIVAFKGDLFVSTTVDVYENEEIPITLKEPAPFEFPLWGLITVWGILALIIVMVIVGIVYNIRIKRKR
jgi:parallel beta-helix repeat protein